MTVRIGLISDTHDLLRPQASAFLRGAALILHAGDICGPAVLDALGAIARTVAVRGNNDRGAWADELATQTVVEVGQVRIAIVHDLRDLDRRAAAGVHAIVCGHSHKPAATRRDDGVLVVNPGSAGPRRFALPVSVGELIVAGSTVTARLVTLTIAPPPSA